MTLSVLVALPFLAALATLANGHRSVRAVQLLGCVPTFVAFTLALVLGGEHWGTASPSSYVGDSIATGGIAITPAFRLDQLSAAMLLLATGVALLVQIYSVAFMGKDPRYPTYTALILLFTAAMSLVVAADDLFVLLVGWEVMGACSYFLIAHYWEGEPSRQGAAKAFLMTRLGDVGLLFGIFTAGRAAGTYRISGVLRAVADGRVSTGQATIASLLILCGVVGKSAQFPLHSWLPDAMPGPTPITALIHAATMVAAGVYLVARLLPLFQLSAVAMTVLTAISVVTMLGGACFALVAEDLKRVLAWSTVSQLAYMFGALSLGGYGPGVLHLLSHGAFKALLFLAAGSVISVVGSQRLADLGGLWRAMPVTFASMSVGLAALAGLPPFVGFFSKEGVLGLAARDASDGSARAWLVLVAGLLTAGVTAAYAMRTWLLVFFGSPAEPAEPHAGAREPALLMTGPVVMLAVLTTAGGLAVLSPGFLNVAAEPWRPVTMVLSLAVSALGLVWAYVGWRRLHEGDPAGSLGRARPVLVAEMRVDAVIDAGFVRSAWLGSRVSASTETEVLAPYVRGTDAVMQLASRGLRWLHAGYLTMYLAAVVLGALVIGVLAALVQR